MKLKFIGAAREVTGSKHLLEADGLKILLDCGMFQGKGMETDAMNRDLGFNPQDIDYLVLSHAHIDHSGLIPYIVKLGFKGTIICTSATRDLCAIMLADCGKIQEHDTKMYNKKRLRRGQEPVQPIYTVADASEAMQHYVSVAYNKLFKISPNISLKFFHTGHLLGGGVVYFEIVENGKTKRLAYTGDIGRPVDKILKAPQPFPQVDYLITESTYGNRLHKPTPDAAHDLLEVVVNTCVRKKGKLIIPSFSVGRTQEVVYYLNNFFNQGKLPKVDIFVDSPLSVNATEVVKLHPECYNQDVIDVMATDSDPFGFNSLHYVTNIDDSKKLNQYPYPCVIISSSGMMEAGRVKHHLANSISNPANTILAVGYCAPSTLGARILRGDKKISIFGNEYEVKADIERIEAFSGHGDYNEMLNYLGNCQNPQEIQKVFLVHGEYESQSVYKEKMKERGFDHIEIPAKGEEFEV